MSLLLNRDVDDLRSRMNRLFDEGERSPRAWTPAVDVSEDADGITLDVELPGLKKEEIEINLTGGTLRLSGERKREEVSRGEHFHRIERQYGAFSRTFQIETPIDAARVTATYENGVLTVRLPKQEAVKPRQIHIDAR
jgi:HSP20 family protein